MRKTIILQLATLICFWIIFLGLQDPSTYDNSLGLISNNWQNKNGKIALVAEPYEQLTNDKYIQWDGSHYYEIKNSGYNIEKAGGDYILAFFPLFPFIWKITNLPAIGILFLNYIFYSISILILLRLLSKSENYLRNIAFSLSLPSIIIFLIPYTEATFMLMICIGIYGFMKKKYSIFFVGFLLASMTSPSFILLLSTIIGTEFFYLIRHKNIKSAIINTFLRVIPLLIGGLIVSLIQYKQVGGSLFKFIEVQKHWNHKLAIPYNLRDWSEEGFAINIGVIVFIFIPLLILFFRLVYNQLNKKKLLLDYKSPKDYLLILSILYLIGNNLFVLLFQEGNLHCLFRFTICSPFFYILLYTTFDYIRHISINSRLSLIILLTLASLFMIDLANYSTYWNFSDFGLFVFIVTLFFWLFQDLSLNKMYKPGVILLLLINLIWTTYLFNTYIANGWIFT